ncbi:MAG: 3TM-type holin [Alphaproteobacteria bacterium]
MWAALVPALVPLVDRIIGGIVDLIPNEKERDKLKAKAQAELLEGLKGLDLAQIDVNKEEARHASVFVAGWRPAVGWFCALGVGYQFLVRPLAQGFLAIGDAGFEMPGIESADLLYLLGGLLGIGTLRTFEKLKGAARDSL